MELGHSLLGHGMRPGRGGPAGSATPVQTSIESRGKNWVPGEELEFFPSERPHLEPITFFSWVNSKPIRDFIFSTSGGQKNQTQLALTEQNSGRASTRANSTRSEPSPGTTGGLYVTRAPVQTSIESGHTRSGKKSPPVKSRHHNVR